MLCVGLSSAHAEMFGKKHDQYFLAEEPGTACHLVYQSILYPGSTGNTYSLVGELTCSPQGLSTAQGVTGSFYHNGGVPTGYASHAWSCTDTTPPFNGCARPGFPISIGNNVQNVPTSQEIDFHISNVLLRVVGPGLTDPWVITPIAYACLPGSNEVYCRLPFGATDPQEIDGHP
jgi:hypothetical protein